MKLTVEFDSIEEFESFRSSVKKSRGKGAKDDVEDVATTVSPVTAQPAISAPAPQPVQQAPAPAAPPPAQTFSPPPVTPSHGFPGSNGATPPAPHPLATGILSKIDGAISSGQSVDAITAWFRQQIGTEAASASLDQIRTIFIPRLTEVQLKQIAPLLGIPV
jgi:hypothetical protein